jgi:uroporphyrinogen decarboxylase
MALTQTHSSRSILDDLRSCAACRVPTRVPFLPLGCDFDVRQTPFTHREYRKDPDKMLALWKLIVAKFDYDWALLFPDDLIEWEFTGIETTDDEWVPPGTMKYLSATRETLELLRLPEPATDGRMPLHLRGLRLLKDHFQGSVCITGRVAAPFSAVALVLGVEAALMLMLDDPPLFRDWMAWAERCNEVWIQAQIEAGADALWIGDCIATSKFISLDRFRAFALESAAHTAAQVNRLGAFSFYHGNETKVDYLKTAAANIDASAINFGEKTDLGVIKAAIGNRRCIMGNLDPIGVLQQGSRAQVEDATARIVQAGMSGGGYIFCTGEGIPHNTPPENVNACVATVRRVGGYDRGCLALTHP